MIMDEEQFNKLSEGVEIEGQVIESEPVNDEVATPEVDTADKGTTEAETTLETTESQEDDTQANNEGGEPQSWQEKRLAKATHKQKRAEEKLREMAAELEKLKGGRNQETEQLPEIPAYPDLDLKYDDPEAFERQLRARDEAIQKHAEAQFTRRMQQEQQTAKQREAAELVQNEVKSIVEKYSAAGLEAGLSADKMAYNEDVLQEAGVTADLAKYLYTMEKGPQVVDFLAEHPSELERLTKLNPFQAVEYITLNIKAKAGVSKSKATKAPDPVKPAKGGGSAPKDPFDEILPAGYSIT